MIKFKLKQYIVYNPSDQYAAIVLQVFRDRGPLFIKLACSNVVAITPRGKLRIVPTIILKLRTNLSF